MLPHSVPSGSEAKRAKYLSTWIFMTLAVPMVLDYLFLGTSIARYSRVLIFLVISVSVIMNSKLFLSRKLVGLDTIVLTISLFLIGTVAGLARGGVITPNIASLILLMMIVGLNFDLYKIVLRSISFSVNFLIALSVIAIILELNPRSFYANSAGYPVFFDFLGIPGRNYGIFSHPNTLGQAAALSILFIIESRKNRLFLIAPIFCILKSGSRTSIIAILVGLFVYGFIRMAKTKKLSKVSRLETPVVVGTLVLGVFLASSLQFLGTIRFLDPGSLTGRVSIWQGSLDLFKESSLIGLGWGWEERAIDSQLLNTWSVSSHNAILEIIFCSGILGLIVFLTVLTKGIVYLPRMLPIEKMILLSILISGVSEAYIDLQYPSIQTFLFFFIILGAQADRRILNE